MRRGISSVRRGRWTVRALLAGAVSVVGVSSAFGQTTASWLLPVSGTWTDATKWSTNPLYPTNGNPVGTTYEAMIAAGGSTYEVSLLSDVTLERLTLNSSDASIRHNNGWLEAGTLSIQSGTYNLHHGKIRNTRIERDGGTGQFVVGADMPTLRNVTAGMDLSFPHAARVSVEDGLTLDGHDLRFVAGATLLFYDVQPLGGTGQVIVDSRPSSSGYRTWMYAPVGTFTIGPNITVRTGSYVGGSGAITLGAGVRTTSGVVRNQGTLSAQTANMEIKLEGNWINEGLISLSAGRLVLGGRFTPSSVGNFVRTGGTVVLTGVVNALGQTLLLDQSTGSWEVDAAEVGDGRVEAHDGARLNLGIGEVMTLRNVTLAAPILMDRVSSIRVDNGLTFDGGSIAMISHSSTSSRTTLDFATPTTIGGTGEIVFQGGFAENQILAYNETGPVSFGANVTLRADTGGAFIRAVPTSIITFQGQLIAGPGARRIILAGPIAMNGQLQIDPGGDVPILQLTNLAAGQLTGGAYVIGSGSTLRVGQAITSNAAALTLNGPNSNIYVGESGSTDALAGLSTISTSSSLRILGGRQLTVPGPLTNRGSLEVGAGSTLSVPNGLVIQSTGTLTGGGTIVGPVTNGGRIQPGILGPAAAAPFEEGVSMAPLVIDGNLTFNSSFSQLIVRLDAGANPDVAPLVVAGALELRGRIWIDLLDGFMPTIGSEFNLMDFNTLSGTFGTITLPPLEGEAEWYLGQLYTTGVVQVVPEPMGLGLLGLLLPWSLKRPRRG